MNNNGQSVNFSELIWRKIRQRQRIEGISDDEFALILGVNVQSLKNYDKTPASIKLERLDNLFLKTDIKLIDLVYGVRWDPKEECYCTEREDAGYFNGRRILNFWSRDNNVIYSILGMYNNLRGKRKVD